MRKRNAKVTLVQTFLFSDPTGLTFDIKKCSRNLKFNSNLVLNGKGEDNGPSRTPCFCGVVLVRGMLQGRFVYTGCVYIGFYAFQQLSAKFLVKTAKSLKCFSASNSYALGLVSELSMCLLLVNALQASNYTVNLVQREI